MKISNNIYINYFLRDHSFFPSYAEVDGWVLIFKNSLTEIGIRFLDFLTIFYSFFCGQIVVQFDIGLQQNIYMFLKKIFKQHILNHQVVYLMTSSMILSVKVVWVVFDLLSMSCQRKGRCLEFSDAF